MIGARAAAAGDAVLSVLERFGTSVGTVFQLKDDEIGLFGDEGSIGKPVGSDIREGKKTLHYVFLAERLTPGEKDQMSAVYGNPGASGGEIEAVRSLMMKYEIQREVDRVCAGFIDAGEASLKELSEISGDARALLEQLLRDSIRRKR